MKELFDEQVLKTEQINNESLAKFPGYTSEEYLDDVLNFFYAFNDYYENKEKFFSDFRIIDERSLQKDSNIKFIKEIEQYNFNIIERYILLYLAVSKVKINFSNSKNRIIETLIEKKVTKPSIIMKILSEDSKLFKSKCIKYMKKGFSFEKGEIEIDCRLSNILFNTNFEKNTEIKKEDIKEKKFNILPKDLYNKLNKYVVGQDNATMSISASVYEHIIKCKINKDENKKDKLDKTNTLIIGHTGTGKTFICNTLSKILDIPIYIADASQFTESGYVGLSPESIFIGLERKCRENMKGNKFPISIIYIDEIDKIAITKENERDSIGNKGVQEELLKILESNKYFCDGGRYSSPREFDISNVMFILGGAFSGLEKIIENRLNFKKNTSIGFFKEEINVQDNLNILQKATTDDIIKYGFMPEFIGRLPNKVILNTLTKQDLIKILTESQNNIISQYKQVFTEAGIKLEILKETIEYVAEQAIKNNTGARGLKSILSGILNKILFETASKGQTDFTLSPKDFSLFSYGV